MFAGRKKCAMLNSFIYVQCLSIIIHHDIYNHLIIFLAELIISSPT